MELPLYRQVADRLAAAVRDGVYRQGDRLPSVRMLARDRGVSINTVIEAYRDLSAHGLITARPQAGYFVSAADSLVGEPGESAPPMGPTAIGISELGLRVLQEGRRPGMLALGAALPDPAKLPLTELNRTITRMLADDPEISHRYEMPPGAAAFRTAIARLYLQADCRLHPDGIVATAGGLEAMVLALRATCPPGAIVAVESPTYYGILQALDGLGFQALEIPTSPQGGMNLGALRFALDEHRVSAVVVISNFCNPGGSRMSDHAKRELVALLAERDLPLIEDDIYGDLAHDGVRPCVAKSFDEPGEAGRVLLCSSFSKVVSPGLRIGFIAAGRWHRAIERLQASSTLAASSLAQHALARLITNGTYERNLRRVRPLYARSCAAMASAVLATFPPGTRVTRPTGGYVLWVEMPDGCDATTLYEAALRARISVTPGPLFSARGRYHTCIRLNAAAWDKTRQAGISTLGRLAAKVLRNAS